MDHAEWAEKLKLLLKSADATGEDWAEFVSQTEAVRRSSVSDWHVQQTRGTYADFLRDHQQIEAGSVLDEQIGDDAEASIMYWHSAAASSFAQAALDHFNAGSNAKAVALAKRAISHFGHTAEPAKIYETLISKLRSHTQDSE